MTTAKSLSQIALALVVGSSAVFFTACGADSSKAPKIEIRGGTEYKLAYQGFYITSQDDDTIIKNIVVRGRDGECLLNKSKLQEGEKMRYNAHVEIRYAGECEPKNGKFQIEVKTNFGTYTYEGKEYAEATLK